MGPPDHWCWNFWPNTDHADQVGRDVIDFVFLVIIRLLNVLSRYRIDICYFFIKTNVLEVLKLNNTWPDLNPRNSIL